ncbi:MAG: DUF4013 domain-containing protein, partial [Methylococcales bacterium]|nr:DUF4013 domain-containing protein [Methylococcales bacterium]
LFIAMLIPIPFRWIFFIFILYAIVKYAFAVLEHSARGFLTPPDSGLGHLTKNNWIPLQYIVVLGAFLAIIWAVWTYLTLGLAIITAASLLYLMPASIMLLGVTGNSIHAIHPIALLDVTRAIGANYLLLWLMMVVIALADGLIGLAIEQGLPTLIGLPSGFFISSLLLIANFHLLGYVVYQYHETLGYDVDQDFTEDEDDLPSTHSADAIRQEIHILLEKGDYETAKKRLKHKIIKEPNNLEIHHFCHQFLTEQNDRPGIPRHAQQYLPLLLAAKENNQAINVIKLSYAINPDYKIKDANIALKLAQLAIAQHEKGLATTILSHYRTHYPGDKNMVEAQFQYAKLLHEFHHDTAQAKMILRSLIGRHSQHPKIELLTDYWNKLQ